MRMHIPDGAWMRYRKSGRYVYAVKGKHICWQSKPPPGGTKVYTVAWADSQHVLMASGIMVMKYDL